MEGWGPGAAAPAEGPCLRRRVTPATAGCVSPAAQAAGLAAAHSVRLARGDLCALAERLDIVASCRLLPDIRGVPGTEPEKDPGPRA